MNQKLLEQAFGVSRDYRCAYVDTRSGSVQFRLEIKPEALVCPRCGTAEAVIRKGRRYRVLQTVPIGLRPVYLVTVGPRCLCRGCGLIFEIAPLCPAGSVLHAPVRGVCLAPEPHDDRLASRTRARGKGVESRRDPRDKPNASALGWSQQV